MTIFKVSPTYCISADDTEVVVAAIVVFYREIKCSASLLFPVHQASDWFTEWLSNEWSNNYTYSAV